MRDLIKILFIIAIGCGFFMGMYYQKQQKCTDKCQVKELKLKQQISEDRWRHSLILEKR